MSYEDLALKMIKKHEGLRLKPYQCTAGKTTIGYGRNLDDVGISQYMADEMLREDFAVARNTAVRFVGLFNFENLSDARKAVLIDMAFNLGETRLNKFKNFRAKIIEGDYLAAATEMVRSRWYNQVGSRATDLVQMFEAG